MPFDLSFNHLQIAAPPGSEPEARHFYGEILGLKEIEKPEPLKSRGGCWFQCGAHQLHIGIEADFRPAKKAHPAFCTPHLDALRQKLAAAGYSVSSDALVDPRRRFYTHDPFGNRLEFIELA